MPSREEGERKRRKIKSSSRLVRRGSEDSVGKRASVCKIPTIATAQDHQSERSRNEKIRKLETHVVCLTLSTGYLAPSSSIVIRTVDLVLLVLPLGLHLLPRLKVTPSSSSACEIEYLVSGYERFEEEGKRSAPSKSSRYSSRTCPPDFPRPYCLFSR